MSESKVNGSDVNSIRDSKEKLSEKCNLKRVVNTIVTDCSLKPSVITMK